MEPNNAVSENKAGSPVFVQCRKQTIKLGCTLKFMAHLSVIFNNCASSIALLYSCCSSGHSHLLLKRPVTMSTNSEPQAQPQASKQKAVILLSSDSSISKFLISQGLILQSVYYSKTTSNRWIYTIIQEPKPFVWLPWYSPPELYHLDQHDLQYSPKKGHLVLRNNAKDDETIRLLIKQYRTVEGFDYLSVQYEKKQNDGMSWKFDYGSFLAGIRYTLYCTISLLLLVYTLKGLLYLQAHRQDLLEAIAKITRSLNTAFVSIHSGFNNWIWDKSSAVLPIIKHTAGKIANTCTGAERYLSSTYRAIARVAFRTVESVITSIAYLPNSFIHFWHKVLGFVIGFTGSVQRVIFQPVEAIYAVIAQMAFRTAEAIITTIAYLPNTVMHLWQKVLGLTIDFMVSTQRVFFQLVEATTTTTAYLTS